MRKLNIYLLVLCAGCTSQADLYALMSFAKMAHTGHIEYYVGDDGINDTDNWKTIEWDSYGPSRDHIELEILETPEMFEFLITGTVEYKNGIDSVCDLQVLSFEYFGEAEKLNLVLVLSPAACYLGFST